MSALRQVKRSPRTTITKYVDVECDLIDFDDDALLAELESRKLVGPGPDPIEALEAMRHAMRLSNHPLALELLRTYLQDHFGCVLP